MKKALLLLSFIITGYFQSIALPTTLGPGDIAFVAMNTDGTADEFAFVVLKAMTTGTTITFTDYQWLTTGGFDAASAGGACNTETTMIWTAGSDLTVGTIVYVYNPGGAQGFASEATASNGTIVPTPSNCPDFLFPTSGDALYAYQGTRPTNNSATNFLAAINMDGAWLTNNNLTTSGGAAPPLTSAQMIVITPEVDNATLKCSVLPLSGTAEEIRAIVNNLTNWDVSDVTAYTLPRTDCSPAPTFTTHPSNASRCSNQNATFTVNTTNATSFQWQVNTGSGFANISGGNYSASNGSNTSTLTVASTAGLNGATFQCIATGTGSVTSNAATLSVTTATTWYQDSDSDGFGNPAVSQSACTQPGGYVSNNTDCNDAQLRYQDSDGDGFGSSTLLACGGVTNNSDCNDSQLRFLDGDNDGFGSSTLVACGGVTNSTDCNDGNAVINPSTTWYKDADNDNYSDGTTQTQCTQPSNYKLASALTATSGDCNDGNAAINPATVWYKDVDNENYSDGTTQTQCSQPTNYKLATALTATSGDCNDGNAAINPAASEVCNGVDDDCSAGVDNGLTFTTYYADGDGDGFGDGSGSSLCSNPGAGFVTNNTDCNDGNIAINPSALEICDNVDNNCSGAADEGLTFLNYYSDTDNDGYGSAFVGNYCQDPANGSIIDNTDCDDGNNSIHPNQTDGCDNEDNDCDLSTDEDATFTTWFQDSDIDTYGNQSVSQSACSQPVGYVADDTDCDDGNNVVNPGATEVCGNIVDENCNGQIDEGCLPTKLASSYCGITITSLTRSMSCILVSGASNYKYLVENASLPLSQVYETSTNSTAFNLGMVSGVQYGYTYIVKVASKTGGVWSDYGDPCNVTLNNPATFAISKLTNTYCGITVNRADQYLSALAVTGATLYRFEVSNSALGYSQVYTSTLNTTEFRLSFVSGIQNGQTYSIRVAAFDGANWGAYGDACNVTTYFPPPFTKLSPSFCGITINTPTQYLNAVAQPMASNYRFEVTNSGLGYSQVYESGGTTTVFRFSYLTGIQNGQTYQVRVAVYADGVWGSYGAACAITTNYPVPSSKLTNSYCGITISALNQYLNATAVSGATLYRFQVTNAGLGYNQVYTSSTASTVFRMSFLTGLSASTAYQVKVAAQVGGVWGAYGTACTVTTPAVLRMEESEQEIANSDWEVNAYPNPFSNTITLAHNATGHEVSVTLMDRLGKVVYETTTTASEITLGNGLAKGMYHLSVIVGEERKILKVIKQ